MDIIDRQTYFPQMTHAKERKKKGKSIERKKNYGYYLECSQTQPCRFAMWFLFVSEFIIKHYQSINSSL